MSMDDVVTQTAGVIPLIAIGGVAVKMTDSLFGSNKVHQTQEQEQPIKKKINKKAEENGYSRNRAVFGSEKYRPF